MTQIILEIDDEAHVALMLELLGALHFVRAVYAMPIEPDTTTPATAPAANHDGLLELAGIWAGREVSRDGLRQQAWPERAR